MLEAYDKTPFTFTEDEIHLIGSLDVDWAKADPGVGRLSLKLRVSVTTLSDAEALAWVVRGAPALYDAVQEGEDLHGEHGQRPRGLEGTRTVQVWIASDGRPAGEPLSADVEIKSVTVTAGKDGLALTLGMRGRVSARQLAEWDAIAAGPVIAHAVAAQPSLPLAKPTVEIIDLPDDVDPFGDSDPAA